eukprot:CAMPEP_0173261340 /NCGR_PEP_ID=MMETSP1142-20121109/26121_1 /TAXON_ID=483371 /ORGANISM="non described non described, Strain CCMP2298" /LENGTH=100 /DNA_ID=CAMNT_0014196269 /DNA_START=315 /DNA_END=617 /DNA_ORIENTATION=-
MENTYVTILTPLSSASSSAPRSILMPSGTRYMNIAVAGDRSTSSTFACSRLTLLCVSCDAPASSSLALPSTDASYSTPTPRSPTSVQALTKKRASPHPRS